MPLYGCLSLAVVSVFRSQNDTFHRPGHSSFSKGDCQTLMRTHWLRTSERDLFSILPADSSDRGIREQRGTCPTGDCPLLPVYHQLRPCVTAIILSACRYQEDCSDGPHLLPWLQKDSAQSRGDTAVHRDPLQQGGKSVRVASGSAQTIPLPGCR